jgi:DNA-binding beta-propeller fold protein YncE
MIRHQFNVYERVCGVVALCLLAGCASTSSDHTTNQMRISFPDEQALPRITLLGDLQSQLPAFDRTPVLDRFLYGPNDFGKTALRNPQGMALIGERLLICDQGYPNIVEIDLRSGRSLLWCEYDHAPRCPVDIHVAPDGTVFVADTTTRKVMHYSSGGKYLGAIQPPGSDADGFRPCALATANQIMYIANVAGRCIDRFDLQQGKWLTSLRPPAAVTSNMVPTGLAIGRDGTLLIVDSVGGQVQRVDADGNWLIPIGQPGRAPGDLVRPKQVCQTRSGLIYVTDAGRQSVVVYDEKGAFVTEVFEHSQDWPGWSLPMGLIQLTDEATAIFTPEDKSGVAVDQSTAPAAGAYLIVSDSLGAPSLTLLAEYANESGGAR